MFFINPFIYAGGGDFESIATVTVGSGGASSITFSDIPGTFQHLQIRYLLRLTSASEDVLMRFNGDTGSNYVRVHQLKGDGSSASAVGLAAGSYIFPGFVPGSGDTASIFGAVVLDILDYTSTSKHKVTRSFGGADKNGSGDVYLRSGMWFPSSIAAVTSISLTGNGGNFAQHSTAALYGLRA